MTASSLAEAGAWWGNEASEWTAAVAGAVCGVAVVFLAVRLVGRKLLPRASASGSAVLRALAKSLESVRLWLLVLIAIAVAADFLHFPPRVEWWLRMVTFVLVALQVTLVLDRLIVTAIRYSASPPPGQPVPVMLSIVTGALQLVIWLTFGLVLLSAAGVNITAFVASLGVGGIAVALALQNVLGDLFASISIGLDKPFEPGDAIGFDGASGTVSHIGIKSTRIVSDAGEELSIGNAKLLEKLTHNYSRMRERRVAFGFTVPYTATSAQLSQIVTQCNAAVSGAPGVRFGRGHFTAFGENGFTFEFVYHVLTADFGQYRDVQQSINEQIVGIVEGAGAAFATPAPRR